MSLFPNVLSLSVHFEFFAIFSYCLHLAKFVYKTAEIETGMAEKSSWDQANRGENLGLVWRNKRTLAKLSKTNFTYLSSS
jgi:hypothetical protein